MKKIMTTGTMQIELTVDDDLLEKISRHKWNAFKTEHIQCKTNNKIVRLHRFVNEAEAGDEVRRIKGDRYDFRKECFSIKKAVK
jgi:hypothetical protein